MMIQNHPLRRWLLENNVPVKVFCEKAGVNPRSYYKWISGNFMPTKKAMVRIEEITQGRVNHNSMYSFHKEDVSDVSE